MGATRVELATRAPDECGDCGERLRAALAEHDGVGSVTSVSTGAAFVVELDLERCSSACAQAALDRERARLTDRYAHTAMAVEGMDCGGCARTIASAVERVAGVSGVEVSFPAGRMLVEHEREGFDADPVLRRVRRLGYEARLEEQSAPSAHFRWPLATLLTVAATGLLLLAVVLDLATGFPAASLYAAAVAVGIGPIARSGVVALATTRQPEIKLLMTVAALGAVAIGAWMEAALVVVLFSVGELLEGRAVTRARNELAGLVTLAPERARVRDQGGAEREIDTALLEVGDVVVVRPGERLPADGTVLQGTSAVDQAPITGESVPVDKVPGDRVFAGTLNVQGRLLVGVEAAPGDTTLARIGRLVVDAQARRSPSERWVDAFARIYTPIVIGLAVLVAAVPSLAWGAAFEDSFYAALALLILACPCALVLSTPVTIVSALGRASAAGVLVKGGEQLERAAVIDTVAFDKTGTLTTGRPRLVVIDALDGDEGGLLTLAASLETGSEHPLAAAIVAAARERGLVLHDVEDFESRSGFGASGRVAGLELAIGKPAMFPEGVIDARVARALDARLAAGQTAVVVADGDRALGVLGLADPPRPQAREALAQLARLGIDRTVMVTGDNAASAQAVAGEIGVAELRAETLPEDKARIVAELGAQMAMVGDGVNDAPALATAMLGVAMGSAGSDTAIEVADVALMGDDPRKVAGLIGLARFTRATVRQNIAFSLATKIVAVGLLAFGMLPLWGAVVSDVGASLLVVGWGLRVLVATPRGGRPILPSARRHREPAASPSAASPDPVPLPLVMVQAGGCEDGGGDCCEDDACR